MNGIHDLPEPSTFGYDHNYAAWAPNSQVLLCKVPWNASYRDIVRFESRHGLNVYLDTAGGETVSILDATYLKMGQPVDLDIPFNVANEFNYLRVYNASQPIVSPTGKVDYGTWLYYFVTHVEYIAPNNTRFNLQLDVWQTYGYDFQFGQSFVERGHIGIAASNAFDEFGRSFLNVPEGIDVGGEYTINYNWTHDIGSARGGLGYEVLIMSNTSLNAPAGDVNNPSFTMASGSMMENLPSGASIYLVSAGDFLTLMDTLKDKPWITQGIMSITAIPNDSIERYSLLTGVVEVPGMPSGSVRDIVVGTAKNLHMSFEANWRDRALTYLPAEYRHLKKFLTFPFMALEMTTYSGQPIIIKPESWNNPDADFVELPHLVPGSAKIVFYPEGYNRREGHGPTIDGNGTKNDNGEFLDMATSISNFPTFSLLNNSYIGYMASNKNSIAFQYQSADWSQQRALTGNQLSFDQASAGMGLTSELNRLNVNAAGQSTSLANQTAGFQAFQSAGNSMIGAIGSPGGIATGAAGVMNAGVGLAITHNQNNQALNISTNLQNATTNANVSNAGYMADTNLAYANFAAKGDNQNAIAGITAKVQDAKLLQPTTSGQVGGDTFNLAKYKWGLDLKLKMLQGSAMKQIAGYWMRYGYQMNIFAFPPADLHCMSHFTYWKMRETYVVSAKCPEAFKETIRGIFEKGVTVWRNPADMGTMLLHNNLPVGGITI